MAFHSFKTIDIGSIAAGGQVEASWESDGDYTIKHIFLIEKTGASLRKVEVTIRKDNVPYTKDVVPAAVLSYDNVNIPELSISLADGQKIVFGLKNLETAAREIYAVLELWV
jgi:hypothetical protein